MAIWLCQADLENATSVRMVGACFDDDQANVINKDALNAVIDRAEQEVLSWLASEFGPPPLPADTLAGLGSDNFLKYAAVDYAVALMFDRHPEYVRANMKDDRAARMQAAKERMERVVDARQQPPTVVKRPANVGGVAVDGANRIYIPNADGTSNRGDY